MLLHILSATVCLVSALALTVQPQALYGLGFSPLGGAIPSAQPSTESSTEFSTQSIIHSSIQSSSQSSTQCTWYSTTTTLTISVYTTSTVPTPSGFTPIHGETPSNCNEPPSPFPTATQSSLSTSTPQSKHRTSVTTAPISKPCYATTTNITETLHAPPSYAACNAANIVSTVANSNNSIFSLDIKNITSYRTSITPDAYACCVTCIETPGCAYSGWKKDGPVMGNPVCELWFQEKCDGGLWLGSSFFDGVGEAWTVANGACGQIVYGGPG